MPWQIRIDWRLRPTEVPVSTSKLVSVAVAVILIAVARHGAAHDAFDAVKCDGDVAKALIGSKLANGRVAEIEKAHSALELKNEGGEEITDSVTLQAWTICGRSYHLLERNGVVRDVLHADHSVRSPAYLGPCESGGSTTPYLVFAILDAPASAAAKDAKAAHASPSDQTALRASAAWRIDESSARFVPIGTKDLTCPRGGISTADGGP
jgi:hypothetical protein